MNLAYNDQRLNITPQPDDTPEILGTKLAARLMWDGGAITAAFLEALTEANFHQLRAELDPIIQKHLEG
jgi:hypothetical protein